MEHLGHSITRNGVSPQPKKVEAINRLKPPTAKKELRTFLGMVNCCRDPWRRRSHILAPLTSPVGGKGNATKWTKEHQNAFEETKRVISKETLLVFPDCGKTFHVFADASDCQIGAAIMQENEPLAFHSCKMNAAQKRCTAGEQELLSIAEALKEFCTLLFGQQVTVHADHKNMLCGNSANDRITRWRSLIEECQPEIRHVAGKNNAAADALSRMEANFRTSNEEPMAAHEQEQEGLICACALAQLMRDESATEVAANEMDIAFAFASEDDSDMEKFPMPPKLIAKEQKKCRTMRRCVERSSRTTSEQRAEGVSLLTCNQRIIAPETLQARTTAWRHMCLRHPGRDRMMKTMEQLHWRESMSGDMARHARSCRKWQLCKKVQKKHGFIPAEEAEEAMPWKQVNVDLTGPWAIRAQNGAFRLKALTMVDPATGWFEIAEVPDATAATVAETFDHEWLSRHPRPHCIGFDGGGECKNAFKEMIRNHGITPAPTTTHNPQANGIVERVHSALADVLKTFELEEQELKQERTFKEMPMSAAFATRSACHATLKATPVQLVFGRDVIPPIEMEANWERIRQRRQEAMAADDARENNSCVPHVCKAGDKVACNKHGILRKLTVPRTGPHEAHRVHGNGALRINRGAVSEQANIHHLTPCAEDWACAEASATVSILSRANRAWKEQN